ncbi:MAG: AAA family ATPase, partial [Oscillospiraceae bacterium]|nr:AAA family ATPase [Oscillospiraceae bacterium]
MKVKQLQLHNFRNYEHLDMTFGPGVNVLSGFNGQGKTNLL